MLREHEYLKLTNNYNLTSIIIHLKHGSLKLTDNFNLTLLTPKS